jgi:hypothetical protein
LADIVGDSFQQQRFGLRLVRVHLQVLELNPAIGKFDNRDPVLLSTLTGERLSDYPGNEG